jgi:NAD-dependent SIR2 family protein deacetylase
MNQYDISTKKISNIVNAIKSGTIRKVIVLTGAGISCATGIPDFRSPGGLYQTLKPELITATNKERELLKSDPTYVVHIDMFKNNPFPYLEVRRPFILGSAEKKWKPSLSHVFFQVLHEKGLLQRLYTQNIDGLDFQLGMDEDKIVNLHGSLAKVGCEFCSAPYPIEDFIEQVRTNIKNIYDPNDITAPKESSKIYCPQCGEAGLKPVTVMYGSSLPDIAWEHVDDDFTNEVDLLIVAGTSLTISPSCDFVNRVSMSIPRLVVNNQIVGENLGMNFSNKNSLDSILMGSCDEGFLYLASELGWINDMYKYRKLMCPNSAALIENAYDLLLDNM